MRTLLIAFGISLALAACGGAASPGQPAPAQIQTTPAAQPSAMPSATPAQGGYEGY